MSTYYSEFRKEQQITSVRLLKNSNLTGVYNNGYLNNGIGATLTLGASTLTIDSVVCNDSDRVLLIGQTNSAQNGIYQVSGIGSSNVILSRTNDFQSSEQIKPGYFIPIDAGVEYSGKIYTVVEPQVNFVGIDEISMNDSSASPTSVQLINTGLNIFDPDGSNLLTIVPTSDLTDDRTFSLKTGDENRLLDISAINVRITEFGASLVGSTSRSLALNNVLKIFYGTVTGGTTGTRVYSITGLAAEDIVTCNILTSQNSVSINKVVPGTDQVTLTFSSDPGTSTVVQYIAIKSGD